MLHHFLFKKVQYILLLNYFYFILLINHLFVLKQIQLFKYFINQSTDLRLQLNSFSKNIQKSDFVNQNNYNFKKFISIITDCN